MSQDCLQRRRRRRCGFSPWVRKTPLQHSCLENPRQRSLVGYSPWGCTESDAAGHRHTLWGHPQIQEGQLDDEEAELCWWPWRGRRKGLESRVTRFFYLVSAWHIWGFPCGSAGKESACSAGDLGLSPGLERSPGKGKGDPLQYSGLENSMHYIVHGVAKSWTRLSKFHWHIWI